MASIDRIKEFSTLGWEMNLAGSELNKFVSERCVKVLGAKELELESWRDREDREKEVKLAQL